ncbi:hypothetical protein [Vibrio diabolicus]|uniref:hypothetical protein n=1 Tax=Vibrio diabolicus TaxID=50719 RepID=UPI002941348A|nr:hypothetical protein [Vibrio diabolicus]MDV5061953.1 hypothetical protein [Vibrio diabolicus]
MAVEKWDSIKSFLIRVYRVRKALIYLFAITLLLLLGFAFGKIYTLEYAQKLLGEVQSIEKLELIFSLDDFFVSSLVGGLTFFFSITTVAMVVFYKRPEKLDEINFVLRGCSFLLKLPARFLLSVWWFGVGFFLYALYFGSPLAFPILILQTVLFGAPGLLFEILAKFQIVRSRALEILIVPVIAVWSFASLICIVYPAYDNINSAIDISKFLLYHFVEWYPNG